MAAAVIWAPLAWPGCPGTGGLQDSPVIDDFETAGSRRVNCAPYGNERTAAARDRYCLFFVNARAELSATGSTPRGISLAYELPRHPLGGTNWLSVRREIDGVLDLSAYSGVRLRFRVRMPSTAVLRITLADVASRDDVGRHNRDELWWCDRPGVLNDAIPEWQTVDCSLPTPENPAAWAGGC